MKPLSGGDDGNGDGEPSSSVTSPMSFCSYPLRMSGEWRAGKKLGVVRPASENMGSEGILEVHFAQSMAVYSASSSSSALASFKSAVSKPSVNQP